MSPLQTRANHISKTIRTSRRVLLTVALAALVLLHMSCGEILLRADKTFAAEASGSELDKIATNIFCTSTYLGSTKAHHFILIDDHPPFIHGWSKLYKVPRHDLQAGLEFPYPVSLKNGKRVIFKQDPSDHSIGFHTP